MASAFYNKGLERFTKGQIDLTTHDIRIRPMRVSAYTFSASAHEFVSSLPAAIVGDIVLGTKVALDGTFDAADAVASAVPAGAAIDCLAIFRWVTSAADSPLIAYLDGFTVTPNGGDITFVWQATTPWIFKI